MDNAALENELTNLYYYAHFGLSLDNIVQLDKAMLEGRNRHLALYKHLRLSPEDYERIVLANEVEQLRSFFGMTERKDIPTELPCDADIH